MWEEEGERRLGQDGGGGRCLPGRRDRVRTSRSYLDLQLLKNLGVVTLTFILLGKHIHKEYHSFFPQSKVEDRKIVRLTYSTIQVGPICWLSSRSAQIMSIQTCVNLLIEGRGTLDDAFSLDALDLPLLIPETPINTLSQYQKTYGEDKHYPIKNLTPAHLKTLTDPCRHP